MAWEDVDKATGSRSDFYELEDGDNTVRVVSEPIERTTHFIKADNKSYPCIRDTGLCKFCNEGDKPKTKFMFYVIDRNDSKVKIAEFSGSIAKAMRKLQKTKSYEFDLTPPYDMIINKTGRDLETRYSVLGARQNTELTPEEVAAISELRPMADVVTALNSKATTPALATPASDEVPLDAIGMNEPSRTMAPEVADEPSQEVAQQAEDAGNPLMQ